jgi:phytol kinase
MKEEVSVGIVLSALAILIAGVHRWIPSSEWSRKAVHLSMGTICLFFPFLFEEAWTVDLLAGLAILSLWILKRSLSPLSSVLQSVGRLSFGEFLFPLSVAIVFRLSNEMPYAYFTSIGILSYADAAGALIGKRFGRHFYRTPGGHKSIEGSLTVFIVSFVISWMSLYHLDSSKRVAISFIVACGATLIEGILTIGLDNLLLPLSIFALLSFLVKLTAAELVQRIILLPLLFILFLGTYRFTSLRGGWLLCLIVLAYLTFACGGFFYLIALLLLYVFYLSLSYEKS